MFKKTNSFYSKYFNDLSKKISSIDHSKLLAITKLIQKVNKKNKIILVGNGGSASMASHVAVDITKFLKIRSVNFNEPNLLTCFSNDYGYENWVVEALKAYALKGDLVILVSSSGQSKNLINGARKAKKMGLKLVTLTGFRNDNPLRKIGDVNLWADSKIYNIIEMTHHVWLLSLVDFLIKK
jgi:D-sedoheptulose 7-phosphate isomerase